MLSLCLVIQRGMRVTPLGFCLRIIVNENPLNLEKTKSSVHISVLYRNEMNYQYKIFCVERWMGS